MFGAQELDLDLNIALRKMINLNLNDYWWSSAFLCSFHSFFRYLKSLHLSKVILLILFFIILKAYQAKLTLKPRKSLMKTKSTMTDTKSGLEASLPLQEILQNKVELLESALQTQYVEEISLSRQLVEYNVLLNDTFQVYYICLPTSSLIKEIYFA